MDIFLFSDLLSFLALCAHLSLGAFLLLRLIPSAFTRRIYGYIRGILRKRGMYLALIVSVFSTLGPLTFSHVYGLLPCLLCWYQRVFMFPLLILLAIASARKDRTVKKYVYALSGIGGTIAVFHYASQRLTAYIPKDLFGCDAVGIAESCSEYYFLNFGYITIPLMSLTAFLLITVLVFHAWEE